MSRPYKLRAKVTQITKATKVTTDRAAALAATLLPLAYFFQAVRGHIFLSPDDGVIFNIPLRAAAAQIARGGSLPLWNPYIFGGMPLHASAQAGLLFPLNWFYLLADAPAATNLMMLSTYMSAALGAYLYARRSGAGTAGAFTTSLVYQWSGFLIAQIGHTNVVQTAALLPWLLWAIDGYGTRGGRSRALILAALVALQVFAGHQQTLAYSLLLAAAYALFMSRAEKELSANYLRSLVFVTAGVLLAAVQIVPTLELLRNSPRAAASYDFFTSFSMPPRFVLTFVAPYVFGGGDGRLFRAPYVGPSFYGEYVAYVGVATLMLALAALLLKADARTKFWAVAGVVCLALAFGRFWPFKLYGIIYYVPVLNLFRVPARHLMEVEFALAVLAGRGLSAVAATRGNAKTMRRVGVAAIVVFLTTCIAVTWGRPPEFRLARQAPVGILRAPELFMPLLLAALSAWALTVFARGRRRGALFLLLAVLALDLMVWGHSSGWRTSGPTRASALWRGPEPVKFLRETATRDAGNHYRILTSERAFDPALPAPTNTPADGWVLALQPDIYMMHGIENAAGYDGFGLARYSRLAGDMKVWGELTDPERTLRSESREVDILNVRYLLARSPDGAPVSASTAFVSPSSSSTVDAPASSSSASSSSISSSVASAAPVSATSFPPATQTYGGRLFAAEELNLPSLDAAKRLSFSVPPVEADGIALLTNLSWSTNVPDGAPVARVRLRAENNRTYEFDLRAGEHASEWAYDRADIRAGIRHKRAPVATSYTVEDAQGNYEGHSYVASFPLPERAIVTGGEITVERRAQFPDLSLGVLRISLTDAGGSRSFPLSRDWIKVSSTNVVGATETTKQSPPSQRDTQDNPPQAPVDARWRRLAQMEKVIIYENARALPRAWLATGELVLSEQDGLNVIRSGRLPDGSAWNPLETALVEAPTGNVFVKDATVGRAELTRHEPNRVEIRTSQQTPAVLVLSENHYPGWHAYVDGQAVETLRVNYNLRGVALPAGEHIVEFVYRPKSVWLGLIISFLTAAALLLWPSRGDPVHENGKTVA